MKKAKILVAVFSIILLISAFTHSLADFGNFDTYDSGGWDSGWDSDWDSGSSSSSTTYYFSDGDSDDFSSTEIIITLAIIALVIFFVYKKNSSKGVNGTTSQRVNPNPVSYANNNESIGNKIRETDPSFNVEKFIAFVNQTYIKLQNAWSDRDLEPTRLLMTSEMYSQMAPGAEQYKKMGRINIMDRIGVQDSYLVSYSTDNEKETLSVYLYATQLDYIIDENTRKVIDGSDKNFRHSKYLITFIRSKGNLTETHDELTAKNCPNCGAPLEINASGRCAYCGSIISNDDHSWVVSVMKRVN